MIYRRIISGYSGYEISSDGRVFSKDRYVNGVNGSKRLIKGMEKSICYSPSGHKIIQLSEEGIVRTHHFATIFAKTFFGYNPDTDTIHYIDGNADNISVDNIEITLK